MRNGKRNGATPLAAPCLALLAAPAAAQVCPDWSALGTGLGSSVQVLVVHDDGGGPALFAGGSFGGSVKRWDGAAWTTVGSGTNGSVATLAVFDDGGGARLFAGGSFSQAGGVAAQRVARWDGTSWSAVGTLGTGVVNALAVFDDGSGPALHAGGTFAGGVARWDGASWSTVGGGVAGIFPDVLVLHVSDIDGAPALYAGGSFDFAGGNGVRSVARWDGATWSSVGGNAVNDTVTELVDFVGPDGPALFVGGTFTAPAPYVARWDGTSWSSVGVAAGDLIEAFAAFHDADGPALYAGGTFSFGPQVRRLARWDGAQWSPLAAGVVGVPGSSIQALAVVEDASGTPALAVGGSFHTVGGLPVNNVALLTGACLDGEMFCYADDAVCPCANGGSGGAGCDNPSSTGGVRLVVQGFAPNGAGGGSATMRGTGFPPAASPTVVLMRGSASAPSPFGDGLLCLAAESVVRLGAVSAAAGASSHAVVHGAGAGDFGYQLWYRSQPGAFCDPAAFNLSNGVQLGW